MTREADYTIKGFVYQFNKTLEELLLSQEGEKIKVEGIVEDIDITTVKLTKAIQCKYHETVCLYTLSDVYKPILQMLIHYSENKTQNIKYILYAHFPNEPEGEKQITKTDIETILKSINQKYIADISKIKNNFGVNLSVGIDEFLKTEIFQFTIGKPFEKLIDDIKKGLIDHTGFSENDISDLFYPNAIQMIADKSIIHDESKRIIEKKSFIDQLINTKKVAISRWTKELLTYKKLLENRKKQLKNNLNLNHKLRYFIFNADSISKFEDNIVTFISDYLDKYHYKIKLHSKTPLFCINTSNENLIFNIEERLHSKNISAQTGYIGQNFHSLDFVKEPKRIIKDDWFEFKLRLCQLNPDVILTMNKKKCEDMFLVGNIKNAQLDLQDINIERLDLSNFDELKYLLNLTNSID